MNIKSNPDHYHSKNPTNTAESKNIQNYKELDHDLLSTLTASTLGRN